MLVKKEDGKVWWHTDIFTNDDQFGGDDNDHFTWLYFVPRHTGSGWYTYDVYVRGINVGTPYYSNLSFASDYYLEKDALSAIGGRIGTTTNTMNGKIYEFMVFEEQLDKQGLLGLDSYIKRKYSQYPYGRPNKFYT